MLWLGALSSRSDVVCEVSRVRWPSVANVDAFKNWFNIWPWAGEFKSCGKKKHGNKHWDRGELRGAASRGRQWWLSERKGGEEEKSVRFGPADGSGRSKCTLERWMFIICIKSFTVMKLCWHRQEHRCGQHQLWSLPFKRRLYMARWHRLYQPCIATRLRAVMDRAVSTAFSEDHWAPECVAPRSGAGWKRCNPRLVSRSTSWLLV